MNGTYRQIIDWVLQNRGMRVETCHIAHAKELSNIPVNRAWNRGTRRRAKPCPSNKLPVIQEAFRHFGWNPQESD